MKSISVPLINDDIFELTETFQATLSSQDARVTIDSGVANVTILDDDSRFTN